MMDKQIIALQFTELLARDNAIIKQYSSLFHLIWAFDAFKMHTLTLHCITYILIIFASYKGYIIVLY